jgi:hypothetical protein
MTTTMLSCVLVVLVSWEALPAAAAGLDPGARIRWVSASEPNTTNIGRLVSLSSDTLFVTDDRDSSGHPLPMSSLSLLEVSTGRPNHVGGYALIGGVSGGLTGLALAAYVDAAATALVSPWGLEAQPHLPYHRFFLVGAGIGAALGALIGVGPPGPERWKPIDPARSRLGLAAEGPRLCVTMRY